MIVYEWAVEWIENEDIVDVAHQDALKQCIDLMAKSKGNMQIVLIRDNWNATEGLTNRDWAYMENGKLPEFFADASGRDSFRVPKRFHAEVVKLGGLLD